MLFALNVVSQVLLVLSSLLLVLSILLHKGQGGGMSDMFGGGLTSAMSSSGVGQRNLNIATVVTSLVWVFAIVLFAFTMEKPSVDDANSLVSNTSSSSQAPATTAPNLAPSETPAASETSSTPAESGN
ncbi:MAG: preprotein translocase subunit SecG [Mobiluncus porci]|uniref:Protein-export membrane protein SecG n=1 Tax=Mobiluncus porci TaxID=2652278 RepID=A0A7K0JZT0_9ACTO|nr:MULTISPECIES: preprotein translocase subunit SecG [Mobiluncus]MCI6584567.1 preprotein translocase subunit SecG [Mobiluncus sp.]MDD7541595.1 preprotein translocase subunit SecG [Mobiluncus porci]MDY5748580.1 preprotein translocase subunit SecG [Mobiluncus porci]MST48664.1 preprotein translocase subunit SecG [Mobiluncus porci]